MSFLFLTWKYAFCFPLLFIYYYIILYYFFIIVLCFPPLFLVYIARRHTFILFLFLTVDTTWPSTWSSCCCNSTRNSPGIVSWNNKYKKINKAILWEFAFYSSNRSETEILAYVPSASLTESIIKRKNWKPVK